MQKLLRISANTFLNIDEINYIRIDILNNKECEFTAGMEYGFFNEKNMTCSIQSFMQNLIRSYPQLYFYKTSLFEKSSNFFLNINRCRYVKFSPTYEEMTSISFFFKYFSTYNCVEFYDFTDYQLNDLKKEKVMKFLNRQGFEKNDENINAANEFFNS